MHSVQEYRVTLYSITHKPPAVWRHLGPAHRLCGFANVHCRWQKRKRRWWRRL